MLVALKNRKSYFSRKEGKKREVNQAAAGEGFFPSSFFFACVNRYYIRMLNCLMVINIRALTNGQRKNYLKIKKGFLQIW